MAGRPRASILSLFDPLTSSSEHLSSPDKENNAGEASFFHHVGAKSPRPVPTFRRRLIDIGDMTMDEPSIQDLLEDEEELEQLHAMEDDDDGNTLTWKDMAKAATPKWSKRPAAAFTTPKASPSQRVPLGELSLRDDATPIARKRAYKRPIPSLASKLADQKSDQVPTCTIAILPPSPQKEISSPTSQSFSVFSKPTEASNHSSEHLPVESADPLASSVSTLHLPAATGTLIADTSLPLSMSMSSSQSSQSSRLSLSPILPAIDTPPSHTTLRPIRDESFEKNRHSVDLGASFQLHLNASDSSCDLLNEKISFLDAKDDSFLRTLEMDDFDDEEDLEPLPKDAQKIGNPRGGEENQQPATISAVQGKSYALKGEDLTAYTDRHAKAAFMKRSTQAMKNDLNIHTSPRDQGRKTSLELDDLSVPSTPSSSRSTFNSIMPPVAGLKIVKKAKTITRRLSIATTSSSTSSSSAASSKLMSSNATEITTLASRGKLLSGAPSSPVTSERTVRHSAINTVNARLTRRPEPLTSSSDAAPGNGPRRVLASDGPRNTSALGSKSVEQTKAASNVNGPRRVPVCNANTKGSDTQPSSNTCTGLKQPAKYASSGAASALPKPTSRIPGSRLPAPTSMASSRSRVGASSGTGNVVGKGLPSRKVV